MRISIICAILLLGTQSVFSQTDTDDIPKLITREGRHALLVNGQPFFILGAQVHNSSGWPGMLQRIWISAEQMNVNTLEIPIYWEQIEPRPGKFDFSLIDTLLRQSAEHHVHLVLLWFATWKNGSNHYMPEWMKQDAARYPNIVGKSGQPVDSPSPNSEATLEADSKAFAAVMSHLKKSDPNHTVIMVQVENESGAWGSIRDYSQSAQKMFAGPVPAALLKPDLLRTMQVPLVTAGTWEKVFSDRADEYFQAWYVARFIGKVAAAGKAEYALPMYTNAALRDPFSNPTANNYESGGPTDNVIPIWKIAAPSIDLLAPDIYLSGTDTIMKVLELYDRPDNALFVPELGWTSNRVKYLYEVIARGGIGFSPFGLDDNGLGYTQTEMTDHLSPFAREYAMAAPMIGELAKWGFEGRIKAVVEREDHADQNIDLGSWQAVVSFGSGQRRVSEKINNPPDGKLMIVQLDENRFVVIGTLSRITFRPTGKNAERTWQYLKVEEGRYEKGIFKPLRILNGDETDWGGPRFGITPTVLQVSLIIRGDDH